MTDKPTPIYTDISLVNTTYYTDYWAVAEALAAARTLGLDFVLRSYWMKEEGTEDEFYKEYSVELHESVYQIGEDPHED